MKIKFNYDRSGCKDVFKSYLVANCKFDGELEIPSIDKIDDIPVELISFSKCIRSNKYDRYVHFYEDDVNFERIWNNPKKYLPVLKKYKGVISPDFSIYRDMPLVMQEWNTYRNRAIGAWLQENGVNVIPNIRWADKRSLSFCCLGVKKNGIISIGTHGTIKNNIDKKIFIEGLEYVISNLKPKVIIVYGKAPDYIFKKYKDVGIKIISFDSEYSLSRKASK